MENFESSCPICFDLFSFEKKPLSLKCGHTICEVCLQHRDQVIKEENEESESDSDSENDSIMISKCLICRCIINTKINNLTLNISLLTNNIKYNSNSYCNNCELFYHNNKNIDICLKANHKITSIKLFKDKIDVVKTSIILLDSINIKDKILDNIILMKKNSKLQFSKIISLFYEMNLNIQEDIDIIKNQSINIDKFGSINEIVKLVHLNLTNKKKKIYEHYLHLSYYLKSLKHQKNKEKIKHNITKALSLTYPYYLLGYKDLERIYTVQFIIDTKIIKIFQADTGKVTELLISSLPNVFNENIKIEIDSEGKKLFIIGGSFDNESTRSKFYTVDLSDYSNLKLIKMNDLKFTRKSPAVLYHNDRVFVIGGEKDDEPFSECEYYDIIKGKWIELPALNSEIMEPSVCVLKNVLYCGGVCGYTKINFESLNLNKLKEWKILGIEIKEPIAGHIVAPYDFCNLIVFGGCRVDEDTDYFYNEHFYLVNIIEKNYTKITCKENVINHEFNTVPAFYKNKIIGFDSPEGNIPQLYYYDILNNKFTIKSYQLILNYS